MGRPGPKKTQEYGVEFKRAAVQLNVCVRRRQTPLTMRNAV